MEYERFGALVAPHTDAMARVAAALVGLADAEDAAQEALLRAWQAWPALREAGAVHTWLLRITTNVCRNWQTGRFGAQQRVTQSLESDSTQTLLQHAGVSGPGTASHTDALDLQRAIAELTDDLRYIIALRFYAGLDATEIGALLDAPPATIRTRLRRALTLLRDSLESTSGAESSAWTASPRSAPLISSPISRPGGNA